MSLSIKKILFLVMCMSVLSLHAFMDKVDFALLGGFSNTNISGTSITHSHLQGYRFQSSGGYSWGGSAIYTPENEYMQFEGGLRYLEKGYQIYDRRYNHTRRRYSYYYYDEFKSSYLDLFVKFKPNLGPEMEMHDLNVVLKPFLGYAYSLLLKSDDFNINKWDSSILLGADFLFNRRVIMSLEYNKGIKNIFYDGRADHESFVLSLGIIF